MILFLVFMFMRGFSSLFFSLSFLTIFLLNMLSQGWEGGSLFGLGLYSSSLWYVLMVIFFLGLNISNNLKMSFFVLFPLSTAFFLSNNMMMFCLLFEFTLFPLILMIFWAGSQPERTQGLYYFLFFSVFSSYPLIISVSMQLSPVFFLMPSNGTMLAFTFFLPFLVKLPLFFFHIWLPKAHVEAPTLGSIILAGLMLKFGAWGIFRLMFLISSLKNQLETVFFFGMILGAFSASAQSDGKSLVAYSSVCHMNFLGFVLYSDSFSGSMTSILIIFTHGITSSMMFWVVGGIYAKLGSRQMVYLSSKQSLSFSGLLMFSVVIFSNFGVPPTLGFWGEIIFIYVMLNNNIYFFSILFFYLLMTCYFSVFLLLSVSLPSAGTKNYAKEETFFCGGVVIIFSLPILKVFF